MKIYLSFDPLFLFSHPISLLLLLFVALMLYNWWWPIAVYRDATERKVRYKIFWSLFVFFTAGWGMPLYDAWTERPQTFFSPFGKPLWGMKITPQGSVDESLTKHRKAILLLIYFILSLPILLVLYVIIASKLGY